ncbi:MAG: hypothetical protein D9V47_09610 [Clostridia bacterium]|nr:MAG: hypothetical protein D9V47_09610 [Clostridia bacterium]
MHGVIEDVRRAAEEMAGEAAAGKEVSAETAELALTAARLTDLVARFKTSAVGAVGGGGTELNCRERHA